MKPNTRVVYTGRPSRCDLCHEDIKGSFVDGKTKFGPWGNMCIPCFKEAGVGLGTGRGQMYCYDNKTLAFVKVEG